MKNKDGYLRDVKILADHAAYDPDLLPALPMIDFIRGGSPSEVQPYIKEAAQDYGIAEAMLAEHLRCALRRILDLGPGDLDPLPDWSSGDWWGETCPPAGERP